MRHPPRRNAEKKLTLNFSPVAKSTADTVTVPAGYTATVLFRLGDPMPRQCAAYRNDGTDAAATYAHARRRPPRRHALLRPAARRRAATRPRATAACWCMNHEAITPLFLHAERARRSSNGVRTVADEVIKEINVHGVSRDRGRPRSAATVALHAATRTFNRRITTLTEMTLSGPAARHRR